MVVCLNFIPSLYSPFQIIQAFLARNILRFCYRHFKKNQQGCGRITSKLLEKRTDTDFISLAWSKRTSAELACSIREAGEPKSKWKRKNQGRKPATRCSQREKKDDGELNNGKTTRWPVILVLIELDTKMSLVFYLIFQFILKALVFYTLEIL